MLAVSYGYTSSGLHNSFAGMMIQFIDAYQGICVNCAIISWDNGLSPIWCQAIIWINAALFTLVKPSLVNLWTAEQGNADAQNKVNNMGSKHK